VPARNSLELSVTLIDGRTQVLSPDQQKLGSRDQEYVILRWGQHADVKFDLPGGIPEKEVSASTLTITGYYVPYSKLPVQHRLEHSSIGQAEAADEISGLSQICPKTRP
jgi:hypothetical protein